MKNMLYLGVLFAVLIGPLSWAEAKDDRELQKQRHLAQKERQDQRNLRNRELNEATKTFREIARNLKNEYQALLKDLDVEFELKQVELQADREAKIAEAESEYQKHWSGLFLRPGEQWTAEALKELEEKAKAHSDELFRIKKEAAEIAHKEKMEVEEQKHQLLAEMDNKAMDEASSLGLTKEYEPILATPIGGELTRQEEQWNDREQKEVERLREQNRRTLSEFRNGEQLRKWERANLNEDFNLAWEEKSEIHALKSQQSFFNTLMMQAAQGEAVDQQSLIDKFAELAKRQRLVKIKYDQIRKKNRITRREEKKAIQGQ